MNRLDQAKAAHDNAVVELARQFAFVRDGGSAVGVDWETVADALAELDGDSVIPDEVWITLTGDLPSWRADT